MWNLARGCWAGPIFIIIAITVIIIITSLSRDPFPLFFDLPGALLFPDNGRFWSPLPLGGPLLQMEGLNSANLIPLP